ncbi:hypothetical protein L226DRAFT_279130 [Lentinus tigrinus ALCF2SS1-7]|uniref:uncharacterized protein n=1 Tax=Lentinus tigrinus ALCF2SS1-7 TaxID=1328758 RepID=UPI001165FCF3|nr:hypothetical protein L226DRAFT_279130 [Lentinus tigrinus ALCF2SS1-7]
MSSCSIPTLNDDSLLRLFEQLKSTRRRADTRTAICLSCTCSRLRDLSMPVLFGQCRQFLGESQEPFSKDSSVVPCTLWPHIRSR